MKNNIEFSDEELKFLKDNYQTMTIKKIAQHLDRHERAISQKLARMKLITKDNFGGYWEDYEIEILKNNYLTKTNKELSQLLGRGQNQIIAKKSQLKLFKHDYFDWTPEKEKFLIDNYEIYSRTLLAEKLNCPKKTLISHIESLIRKGILPTHDKHFTAKYQKKTSRTKESILIDEFLKENKNKPIAFLAEKMGISKKAVRSRFNRMHIKHSNRLNSMSEESINIIFDNFKLYTAEEIHNNLLPNEKLSDIIDRIRKFKKRLHHTASIPEIQVRNILIQNHIRFGSEVFIRKCNCRVDFLLMNNIVLEVYGDFWHGNKIRMKESSLKKQKRQIKMDINRFAKLCDNGYKVFTLWEYDIMYRPWIVTAHILQIIKYFNLK